MLAAGCPSWFRRRGAGQTITRREAENGFY